MTENLYCKMFVDTVLEYNVFFETVRNFLNGQKQAISGITSNWCDMCISRNKEYIPKNPDFLYWKFIIDIDPLENVSESAYINNLKHLVYFLKQRHNVICACDFEDIFRK
ncbi:MAG: hypothetical protein K2I80_11415 [Ruminococcus sp.]|nr:hypothetical protein [Ruminococcus sp.]MDE6848669.1 hypothetical protein [Ruminococcus sp.]